MPHLAGELLKVAAKVDIVHVPYKGAAPAVNDLLGQQVHMAFFDLPVLLPQVQAGKLKAMVVGSKQRAPSLKDVPTTAELGYAQVEADNWYGMVAPIATPPTVVARLHQATIEALRDPGVREKLSSQGLNLWATRPTNSPPISAARSKNGPRWRRRRGWWRTRLVPDAQVGGPLRVVVWQLS